MMPWDTAIKANGNGLKGQQLSGRCVKMKICTTNINNLQSS